MKLSVPVILVLVIGGALSLLAFATTRGWEDDRAKLLHEREALGHAASLQREISSTIDAVHSIKAFYGASNDVERAEFGAFAGVELENQTGIQALEWIPRVSAADRAGFEAAARADGLAGFSFTERESQGGMVAAAPRAEYFPVYFIEPLAGNEAALGFDLGSNPARMAALEKARDSGETVATTRITLVQETGDQYGFLVFEPVYRSGAPVGTIEERRANLQGFGLGVLHIGGIVESALVHRGHLADALNIFVFDTTAPAGQQLLYPRSATVEDPADLGVAGCVNTPFGVGGRDWLLVHCPAGTMAGTGYWQSWAVLIAGLALSGTLTLYLLFMQRQRARTERMTEGLRASEERYRGLFDNAHDMIQSVDAEGRFAFVNQAWIEAMGYTMEDLADINVFDLITAESKAHCLKAFEGSMAGEPQDNVHVIFVRKDGQLLEAEGNIAPQFSAGRVVATQGIFRDITERKKIEAEREKLLGAIEQLDECVALFDSDDRIVFCNDAYRELGRDIIEFTDKGALFEDYLRAGVRAGMMTDAIGREEEWLEQRMETHRNPSQPIEVGRQNGTTILVNEKRLPDGSCILVASDITEIKNSQQQIIQASKLATLGEMATGMAHELNQPLNVIAMATVNALERIEAGDLDGDFLRIKLARIEKQVERAAGIIDHMRVFGRKADERPKPFDVHDAVIGAMGLMGEQLRLRDIKVSTDFPKLRRKASGHLVQLEQVVLNLLANARDAIDRHAGAPEGAATAPREIDLAMEDDGVSDRIRLIVTDTGGGIPETAMERIFDPFFTTKEVGKGTGLGLSISYGIVTDMGGTIAAENVEGGARFTITLQVAADDAAL